MLVEYFYVLIFSLAGFGFFSAVLLASKLVRERGRGPKDLSPYECGMEAGGSAWISPNVRFYRVALLFVIFDAEVLFIFPWAVQFRALGVPGYAAAMAFAGVLTFGLVYAWRKGALKWE